MMKSVFLSDSTMLDTTASLVTKNSSDDNNDNDYIMVDCCNNSTSFIEEEDDEEYDYCDDAMSEGIQREQHLQLDLTEEMILEEAELPSIQHILDEAHRSASRVVYVTEDEHEHEEKDQATLLTESAESHDSLLAYQRAVPAATGALELPKEPVVAAIGSNATKVEEDAAPVDITTDVAASAAHSTPAPNLGRMSNKKRRKKMKLLKKAAATDKAAAALADNDGSTTTVSAAKIKTSSSNSAKSRYRIKRVANIAVACATETLASYKEDLQTKTLTTKSPNSVD